MTKVDETTRVSHVARLPPLNVGVASLVQIYGDQLGKRYVIESETTIGRSHLNSLVIDGDSVSRRHARLFWLDGNCYIEDVGSTNGTFVNEAKAERATLLAHGDLLKIGTTIFKYLCGNDAEAQYHEEIYQLTITDGLTQVSNRRFLTEFLEREVARCGRSRSPLSLILFDIDNFKTLNDEHGHLVGDRILRSLAALVDERVRREQLLARYGGDEFAVVLPDIGAAEALQFAQKIRELIASFQFQHEDETIRTSVSIGLATMLEPTQADDFFQLADEALYESKRSGRNCVHAADSSRLKAAPDPIKNRRGERGPAA
ncbi:MAG: GGDEF domain-containing protein [Acidobacteriota bacterium]